MCSDEIHFNVLLIVRDKLTKQCLQTTTFLEGTTEAESSPGTNEKISSFKSKF